MHRRALVSLLLTAIPLSTELLAQELAPATVAPTAPAIALDRVVGSWRDRAGDLAGGGADYRVAFPAAGARFEPALGDGCPELQHLQLTPIAVGRGRVAAAQLPSSALAEGDGLLVRYPHAPGVQERIELWPEGVELSWRFDARPAGEGDLVVRYALDTTLPAPTVDGDGLSFVLPGLGGVRIGAVTGVDAAGRRVAGALHSDGRTLELSLPGAFVDAASYPLLLDPSIATLTVSNPLPNAASEPDCAYDAATGRYLLAWRLAYSATSSDVLTMLADASGPIGALRAMLWGRAGVPRVAGWGERSLFGVATTEIVSGIPGTTTYIASVAFVRASDGTRWFTEDLTSNNSANYPTVDIGCETYAPVGSGRGFAIVVDDPTTATIDLYRATFGGTFILVPNFTGPTTIVADGGGVSFSQPAISRSAGADGELLLTMRRVNLLGDSIVARRVGSDGSLPGSLQTVHFATTDDVSVPDVDGMNGQWVAVWQQFTGGSTYASVIRRPVALDNGTLTFGAEVGIGGTALVQDTVPTVSCSGTKAWLGYRSHTVLPSPATTLRIAGIDRGSCVSCNDSITASPSGAETRIAVATQVSGGDPTGEGALAAWVANGVVYCMLMRNTFLGGSLSSLGGECGGGGQQQFPKNPSIGTTSFACNLVNVSPTALLTVFNLAPTGGALSCGACFWVPFSVTATLPVVGGGASISFAIPCLPTLVGAQLETQWTSLDFAAAPCPLLPGLIVSSRALMTFGQ